MNVEDFELADLATKQLDAQEKIVDANVSAYPHFERNDAEKFMQGLHKLAFPQEQVVKAITLQELKELGLGRR